MPTAYAVSLALTDPLLFLAAAIAGSFVLYLAAGTARLEQGAVIVCGLVAASLTGGLATGHLYQQALLVAAYSAVCAFLVSAVTPFFDRSQIPLRTALLFHLIAPPVFVFVSALAIVAGEHLTPSTFDYYLYAADLSMGGAFAFRIAEAVLRSELRVSIEAAYVGLPLAVALVYVLADDGARLLRCLLWIAVVGSAGYVLFPGVGTVVTFGARFPANPPPLSALSLLQRWPTGVPRNCMPSLHTSWALALWWTAPARWRLAVRVYVALVLLGTVVEGGHYLIDVLASVPFAVAMDLATDRQWTRAALALSLFGGSLALIRFGSSVLLLSPVVPWTWLCLTSTVALWLRQPRPHRAPVFADALLT